MREQSNQRRLTAILAADVAGYTRLMEQDTEGTVAAWQLARDTVIDPIISKYSGRTVKLTGDGFLVEFSTVQDAVNCAIKMQAALQSSILDFRMGINLGDIIDDGRDIHGEGVNIAARIESLADAGGISISGGVHDQVRNRITAIYEDRGEQNVKNVSTPVRVYAILPFPEKSPPAEIIKTNVDFTKKEEALSDKRSIAVLPFANMSDSREYEYLADGLTEDIITLLARIPSFLVIARTSTFSYKGKQIDIREIGRELGVRYVIEGSLRPMGDHLRITIQLIEAESGNHLWAERFDGAVADLFSVQDEITTAIVTRLEPELTRAEYELIRRRPPADLDARDYFLQANAVLALKGWHEHTFKEGAELYRKAITLDPDYAAARAALSLHLSLGLMIGYVTESEEAISEADQALSLDGDNSEVLGFVGCAISDLGNKTRGAEILERALERDPSNAQAWVALGAALLSSQQPELAITKLEHGIRISPRDNRLAIWIGIYALALGFVGRLEEAIEQARIACRCNDKLHNPRVVLAALLVDGDRLKEAELALAEARRIRPQLSLQEARGMIGGRYTKALQKIWDL